MVKLNSELPTGYRQLTDVTAITIRHFYNDRSARDAVKAARLVWPETPGALAGKDPCIAWRSPEEVLALGIKAEPLLEILAALAPGQSETAMAADLSEALTVFALSGPALDEWLSHLVDASAIPRQAGRASRCRLADVPVMLLRLEADYLWLVVDRPIAAYLNNWLAYAHQGAFADSPSAA